MRATRLRRLAPSVLALALAVTGLAVARPPAIQAGTADTMEASILTWMNRDRGARGLRPLFRHYKLIDLAGDRAAVLASKNVVSHTAAGDLATQLANRAIQWYSFGENVGMTTAAWGSTAASSLYAAWKGSGPHWAAMMSDRFNYVGIGIARSATGASYGVIVFTESVDQTRAVARITNASRSGTTVTWTWTGHDPRLQTHTAGLRDFDVQYRVGAGSWRLIRDNTTATSLTLRDRPRDTTVAIRVRATDRRGNIGAWTPAATVSIP